MREIVARQLEDISTRDAFCFSVRCAECGGVWMSRIAAFSKAGTTPASEGKRIVFGALYQKERERARNAAIRQAMESFNCCPICGRLVCNRCFLICEDLDMCVRCAVRLNEYGAPVLPPLAEAVK